MTTSSSSIFVFTPKALLLLICLCIQAPVCMHAQPCSTHCDPVDRSPPGSSVHGIFHAGTLEWIAISYSRGCSNPGIEPACLTSRALAGGFFTTVLIQAPSGIIQAPSGIIQAPSGIIQAPSGIKVLFPKCSLKQWFPLTWTLYMLWHDLSRCLSPYKNPNHLETLPGVLWIFSTLEPMGYSHEFRVYVSTVSSWLLNAERDS